MLNNFELAEVCNGKSILFKNMSHQYKMSILIHLAWDLRRWKLSDNLRNIAEFEHIRYLYHDGKTEEMKQAKKIVNNAIIASMKFYEKKYGDVKFVIADIPTDILIKEIMERHNVLIEKHGSWEKYHKHYLEEAVVPEYPKENRFPCLSDLRMEVPIIIDGWHRLHCYVEQKAETIPVVFYEGVQ